MKRKILIHTKNQNLFSYKILKTQWSRNFEFKFCCKKNFQFLLNTLFSLFCQISVDYDWNLKLKLDQTKTLSNHNSLFNKIKILFKQILTKKNVSPKFSANSNKTQNWTNVWVTLSKHFQLSKMRKNFFPKTSTTSQLTLHIFIITHTPTHSNYFPKYIYTLREHLVAEAFWLLLLLLQEWCAVCAFALRAR